VPLYILGSSLFGAQLAAYLGLPYAFASHFAPAALEQAVALYRQEFRPAELPDGGVSEPYVMAAITVIADDDAELAAAQLQDAKRHRLRFLIARNTALTDEEADAVLDSPHGRQVHEMLRHSAVGTPDQVRGQLAEFTALADADELILAPLAGDRKVWLGTVAALSPAAEASELSAAPR